MVRYAVMADLDGYAVFLVVSVTARPHHNNAIIIRDEDRCRTMTYATRTSTCRPSAWAAASI